MAAEEGDMAALLQHAALRAQAAAQATARTGNRAGGRCDFWYIGTKVP